MKKLSEIISFEQVEHPKFQYYIYIHSKKDVILKYHINLVDFNLEEQIQEELVVFIENEANKNEFLLVGNEAVKVEEIVYVKVESFEYIGF